MVVVVVVVCAFEVEFAWSLLCARFSSNFSVRCCWRALIVILVVVVCAFELDF